MLTLSLSRKCSLSQSRVLCGVETQNEALLKHESHESSTHRQTPRRISGFISLKHSIKLGFLNHVEDIEALWPYGIQTKVSLKEGMLMSVAICWCIEQCGAKAQSSAMDSQW